MARRSREELCRNNQGRASEEMESSNARDEMVRRRLMMNHVSKFDFPVDRIPPDKVYIFARLKVRGQEDQDRINSLHQDGWDPVPRSRHPEFVPPKIWGENNILDKYIVIDGCNLLMERSKELDDLHKKRLRRDYEESIRRDVALEQAKKDIIGGTNGDWQPYVQDSFRYHSSDVGERGIDPWKGQ